MKLNIPDLVILFDILPYLYTSNELTKWKVLNKFFNENIITHSPIDRICHNCKTNRFKVYFYQERCKVKDCMAIEIIHPGEDYISLDGKLVCSLGCLMNYATKNMQ
jgi:hypothetical protein